MRDAWEQIEADHADRLEARTLLLSAIAAHDHAMREMRQCAESMAAAVARAERARAHAERAGEVLRCAIRLCELRRAA